MTAAQLDLQREALTAFQRDLPSLWSQHPGQWVAYHGDRQLGIEAQKHELYQRCLQGGFQRDEFVIFCIEAQETEIALGPMVLD
jgi:hypothetical protein